MTSIDFDASLKHAFIIIHVLMLGGAGVYTFLENFVAGAYFGVSSVVALIYYLMYQTGETQRRIEAHLNLIEQAVKESEEFRERVSKKSKEGEGPKETPDLSDILADKNVDEAQEWIEEEIEEHEDRESFLEMVKEAEEEGMNRSNVKLYVTEKLLNIRNESGDN